MRKHNESVMSAVPHRRAPMSDIRRSYMFRFFGRILIFVLCVLLYVYKPGYFTILEGMNFWSSFTPLHVLWGIWIFDMFCQLIPIQRKLPLGSQKLFKQRFRPIREKINYSALREYVTSTTKSAYKVFLLWTILLLGIYFLHRLEILDDSALFMICVLFYVCDLVCVLFWCPFRLIMKNRCCTTCRIFNWDHLMMFTPMMFTDGFYSYSLLFFAILVWIVWELCVMIYPERFWEHSNAALQCSQCTDKLCTQYCQKLRQSTGRQKNINNNGR